MEVRSRLGMEKERKEKTGWEAPGRREVKPSF